MVTSGPSWRVLRAVVVRSHRCSSVFNVTPPARNVLAAVRPSRIRRAVAEKGICPYGLARYQILFEGRDGVSEPISDGRYRVNTLYRPAQGEGALDEVGIEEGKFLRDQVQGELQGGLAPAGGH